MSRLQIYRTQRNARAKSKERGDTWRGLSSPHDMHHHKGIFLTSHTFNIIRCKNCVAGIFSLYWRGEDTANDLGPTWGLLMDEKGVSKPVACVCIQRSSLESAAVMSPWLEVTITASAWVDVVPTVLTAVTAMHCWMHARTKSGPRCVCLCIYPPHQRYPTMP